MVTRAFHIYCLVKVKTSGEVFICVEPTFHLNAKGQGFIFRQSFIQGMSFYDHLESLLGV